jgi:hypothetical protein
VDWLSLSSYNSADPSSFGSDVQGSRAGRSGRCRDHCSNSSGRLGLCSSDLVLIRFIGCSSPGPRRDELADYWAPREVSCPSGGPGGYPSPTSPQSLGWFWNNRPKDPRSSLQSLILTRNASEISLPGHYFWTLSNPVKTIFHCLLLLLFLEIWCSVSGSCFRGQHFVL